MTQQAKVQNTSRIEPPVRHVTENPSVARNPVSGPDDSPTVVLPVCTIVLAIAVDALLLPTSTKYPPNAALPIINTELMAVTVQRSVRYLSADTPSKYHNKPAHNALVIM